MGIPLARFLGVRKIFRWHLFKYPSKVVPVTYFISISPVFVVLAINILLPQRNTNLFINLKAILLLASLVANFIVPWVIFIFTPKFFLDWDEKWQGVIDKYRRGRKSKRLKSELVGALKNFRRRNKPFEFIINLFWGGVFVGCLPIPAFQKVLYCFFYSPSILSFKAIFQENFFGGFCLFFTLAIYPIYFYIYMVPIVDIEDAIFQLELETDESQP